VSGLEGKGGERRVEVRCQYCGQVHRVPRDIFGDREKAELSCAACGKVFQVVNPKLATLKIDTTRKKVSTVTDCVSPEGHKLRLPAQKDLSLKVLEGDERGTVYPVNKPRVTIGRTNADISLHDAAASRVHCALEVSDEDVLVRDLDSTNGTLVDNQPIRTAKLSNGSTFKVGKHLFQLVIAAKGA